MLHKTSSIQVLLFAGLMLGASSSQASGSVGSHYRHQQQYNDHRSRQHQRHEYREQHHNRYRYYGHSPYFSYRPQDHIYRHDYHTYYRHPYRYWGYPGYGGYYHHRGGLYFRLY